jgi:hypothetical protein
VAVIVIVGPSTPTTTATGWIVETGEAAHVARAGRLDRDEVVPARAGLMRVWSILSRTAICWFEVHSILSGWVGPGLHYHDISRYTNCQRTRQMQPPALRSPRRPLVRDTMSGQLRPAR